MVTPAVRRLSRGQVRLVGAALGSGVTVALPLAGAAGGEGLQHVGEAGACAEALGEGGEAVAAQAGAGAAGQAHHHEGVVSSAPIRVHTNITGTDGRWFQALSGEPTL